MYIFFELLACVALACVLGGLLFGAATVYVTVHEAVKLVPSALHRIMHQIPLKARQSRSSVLTAAANARTHSGRVPRVLVLGEARH